jgi:cytochrome P450
MDNVLTTRAGIEAVLADPAYEVPSVPAAEAGLGWLRSTVCRFVNGDLHARRRRLVEDELARLDPAALRREAARRAEQVLAAAGGRLEVMETLARPVPMAVLCAGLGIAEAQCDAAVRDAMAVGLRYLSGAADADTDLAVERLRALLERPDPEGTAAAIAVLAQACEAVAALIGGALVTATDRPHLDADALIAETLERATPLRAMRRLAANGEVIVLDLEAASEGGVGRPTMAFGSGLRPCPGRAEAIALAGGVLDALVGAGAKVVGSVEFVDGPLRLPARIEIRSG